jgi:hypothetical protein
LAESSAEDSDDPPEDEVADEAADGKEAPPEWLDGVTSGAAAAGALPGFPRCALLIALWAPRTLELRFFLVLPAMAAAWALAALGAGKAALSSGWGRLCSVPKLGAAPTGALLLDDHNERFPMMLGLQHARREELLEPLAFQKKSKRGGKRTNQEFVACTSNNCLKLCRSRPSKALATETAAGGCRQLRNN